MNELISKIVIVGGGSAGWMTAAMLSTQLKHKVNITLIESEQIGTIGVGEATIPPIKIFNDLLGIAEQDFLKQCNGSIKLGIQFENWGKLGDNYMHPFGSYGIDFDYMPFPYFWFKAKLGQQQHKELQEYSLAWHLAKADKFAPPSSNPQELSSRLDYAYHFDAGLYAKMLRNYSEAHGVNRVEGKIIEVIQQPDSEHIAQLKLDNGKTIDGELFIDCSGQNALLLAKTLQVEFDNWSEYLLNDSAIAVQTAHMKSVAPYTRSIANHAGWQWRIPLQTRMGNGIVYSSQYMSDEEALTLLLNEVEGPTLTEPNFIKFKVGKRKQVWKHNCIAIGLSAGFLEPLESTSLHLIQSSIMRLLRYFPDKRFSQHLIRVYNELTEQEYLHIRDFIILHYHATTRDDSDYWQACQSLLLPESLQQKLDLFQEHGHLVIHDKELFKENNWLAVLTGQGIMPKQIAPVLAAKNQFDLNKILPALYNELQTITSKSMSHEMYLVQNCRYTPDS